MISKKPVSIWNLYYWEESILEKLWLWILLNVSTFDNILAIENSFAWLNNVLEGNQWIVLKRVRYPNEAWIPEFQGPGIQKSVSFGSFSKVN